MSRSNKFLIEQEKYQQAGQIAAKALAFTCQLVKPKQPLLDIAESGEQRIRELGGQPAFPINISVGHHAAHHTPSYEDRQFIPERALVKVDLGVHVEGYIADTAQTVIVDGTAKMELLEEAAKAGLQAAIDEVKAGIRVWDVSNAISRAIRRMGVNTIENLTGHSIERFNLHAGISVPSVAKTSERVRSPRLKEHMIIAIEPFTTYSSTPNVVDVGKGQIYGFVKGRNPSDTKLSRLFSQMKVHFADMIM